MGECMESQNNSTEKSLLMVIDDESLMTELFSKFMIRLGFEVITADSGKSALSQLGDPAVQPKLIITDMSMPEMNGVEFARILAQRRPSIPVLIATGFAASEDLADLPDNVVAIVQKPYQYLKISEKINEILDL